MSEMTPELSAADKVAAAFTDAPVVEETTPVETPVESAATPPPATSGGHPAWNEILSQIPEMLHDKVRPALEKWDKGVQEKLAEYTRTYDPYKPIVGQPVDEIEAGLQMVRLLNENPKQFYDQLREFYKFESSGQGQATSPNTDAETLDLSEFAEDPRIKALEAQQQALIEQWNTQQAAQQAAQAETWLKTRQAEITTKLEPTGITPDWDYILNKAATIAQKSGNHDAALDQATAEYTAMVNKFRTPVANTTAPPVMSPTGTMPASTFDPTTMEADDRKKLMSQMLSQAFKE